MPVRRNVCAKILFEPFVSVQRYCGYSDTTNLLQGVGAAPTLVGTWRQSEKEAWCSSQGTQSHSKSRTCPRVGSKPEGSRLLPGLKSARGDISCSQGSSQTSLWRQRCEDGQLFSDSNATQPPGQRRHRTGPGVPGPLQRSTFGAYTGGDSEPLTPKGEKAYWRLGRCFGGPRWRGAGDEGLGGNTWASRVWKGGRRIYMLFRLCPTSN